MLRPIILLGLVAILMASALRLTVHGKFRTAEPFPWLRSPLEVDADFKAGFLSEFVASTNSMRTEFSIPSLNHDSEIHEFVGGLLEHTERPESIRLNTVFDALQDEFPGAQYLAANLVSASSRTELISQLATWDELIHPEFEDVCVTIVPSGRKLVAMSVLSRRIPAFSLELANRGNGGRFFNSCPHCDSVHALDLDRKNKTLILSCPDCECPYDVLAADSKGQMRRAYDFFTGFQVPGKSGAASEKEQVLAIWNHVAQRCSYEHDHSEFNETEVWKTSDSTWIEKQGDCEDTSILLVDSLISAGFDARVAIGWNGNIGQHAWVVVRLSDEQFVIESTIQDNPSMDDLVPVNKAAPFYRPEQQFDRDNLYFQKATPDEVAKNYFDEDSWMKVSWK